MTPSTIGHRIGVATAAVMATTAAVMAGRSQPPWKTILACATLGALGTAVAALCGSRVTDCPQNPESLSAPSPAPRRRTYVQVRSIQLPDGTVVTETRAAQEST